VQIKREKATEAIEEGSGGRETKNEKKERRELARLRR
jgi:hypothetical protein